MPVTPAVTTPATTPDAKALRAHAGVGKVRRVEEGHVIFSPTNTNYELRLVSPGYSGPVDKPVKAFIRVTARKVWSVPSGGNFITPIFGPPRIVQGRVRAVDRGWIIVQAGGTILVDLPDDDIVYDLANGPISTGSLVNVTALPGATFELATD